MDSESHPLALPSFLQRDAETNRAEFMNMTDSVSDVVENKPAKTKSAPKANGKAADKVAASGAPKAPAKAKAAPKATAKAAKAPDKAKAAKPKAASVEKDSFGFRKGSAKSEAVAMYARKSGATLAEVKEKVGSVQLNVLVALEADGRKVERKTETRDGKRPVTRYFLKS